MKIQNAKSWAPTGSRRWAMALVISLLAFTIRWAIQPVVGARFPLLAFTLSTILIHYRYGLAPALISAVVAFPVGILFFIPPYGHFGPIEHEDVLTAIAYGVLTVAFIYIIQRLRRAQYRAELLSEVAESRYLMLLQSDNDREAAERELATLHRACVARLKSSNCLIS
jgi:K+-sensing histidine kinase KdpD